MGVQEAAHGAADVLPRADVRGVRIALLVGVGVVLAVVGDPVDDRPLTAIEPAAAKKYSTGFGSGTSGG